MGMKIFYLDSFILLNFVLDYLLLLLTARLSGTPAQRWRIMVSSAIGSFFAVWMFFHPGGFVERSLLSVFVAFGMVFIAFFAIKIKKCCQLTGIFLLQSLVFSGGMSVLRNMGIGRITVQNGITYIQIEFWQIFFSAVGAYFLSRLCFRDHSLKIEKQRLQLCAELSGKKMETFLLVDSGNLLREPLSGNPVILLAPEVASQLMPAEVALLLKHPDWDAAMLMAKLVEKGIVTRLIPISSIEKHSGLTIGVKPNRITLNRNGNMEETKKYWIGISRNNIDVCGGCRGVIGI